MSIQMINNRTNQTIALNVAKAHGVLQRMKGLMGSPEMAPEHALWIPGCNWIHTLFVRGPLDIIYLDRNLKVVDFQFNLKPWRIPAPRISAHSVLEFRGGSLNHLDLKVGDQLSCG